MGGTREFRGVKGKERVPVPVAGPAFRSGVKFVIFYVFSSFLQPAAKIDPIQSAFPPVSDPSLEERCQKREKEGTKGDKSEIKNQKESRATRWMNSSRIITVTLQNETM